MEAELFDHSFDLLSASAKPYIQTLAAINKSKLDKAQARRLKMPKRNRSAYFLFSMDTRAKLKAELGNLTPLEMQAKVSQYWKELSTEEKEKYETRAKDEKLEYLAAMEKFYSNLTPETLAKSKSNRPKKPCSAYAHFVRDIKTDLKKENPRLIMQEILHIASDKWKNLEDNIRSGYEERAKADKEIYMAEVKKLSEEQDSPKAKSQATSDTENLGKRSKAFTDSGEKAPKKHIKLEALSTNSESQDETEEPVYRPVKVQEPKKSFVLRGSPFASETSQEGFSLNKGKIQMPFNLEQLPSLKQTFSPEISQEIQIPPLNPNVAGRGPAMYPTPNVGGDIDQLKDLMLARLNWDRLVSTNQSIEQAIVRRITELRTLQAQQHLMLAQRAFLASNAGIF